MGSVTKVEDPKDLFHPGTVCLAASDVDPGPGKQCDKHLSKTKLLRFNQIIFTFERCCLQCRRWSVCLSTFERRQCQGWRRWGTRRRSPPCGPCPGLSCMVWRLGSVGWWSTWVETQKVPSGSRWGNRPAALPFSQLAKITSEIKIFVTWQHKNRAGLKDELWFSIIF